MTEQIPNLDVKTLEYVLKMVEQQREIYEDSANRCVKFDDRYEAEIFDAKQNTLLKMELKIESLIRKQQEA